MYVLYITNKNYSSWSLRPWVLMQQLGIPFEERLVPMESESSAEAFRTFSPTGKVPCLVDQSTVVWDSLGIVEYLAERNWEADALLETWREPGHEAEARRAGMWLEDRRKQASEGARLR